MENGIDFWEGFFLLLIFIPVGICWAYALIDVIRRDDLSGWAVALWIIFIILLPILGMLIYFIARPITAQDIEAREAYEQEVEAERASRVADKLHKLAQLRDKGDITQEQFDKQKAKLLR